MNHKHPTPPPIVRIFCVDDNPDLLSAMRMIIETDGSMQFAGSLESADRLLAEARRLAAKPGAMTLIVLLDARMPGLSPLEAVREIAAELPWVRVVILSGFDDPAFYDKVLDAGAWGFISKSDEPDAILRAIHMIAAKKNRGPHRPGRS
ncbi:MAG: response regulator transcription factor [Planctomycetes bacterium]|nr:response regulator transcription factor [Planctomycetota bacterium]